MLLRNGAKRILDFIDLQDGELDFFPSVDLQFERANGDLFSCDVVVDRNLEDVFETALDVPNDRKVRANEECRLNTGQGAHGTH